MTQNNFMTTPEADELEDLANPLPQPDDENLAIALRGTVYLVGLGGKLHEFVEPNAIHCEAIK